MQDNARSIERHNFSLTCNGVSVQSNDHFAHTDANLSGPRSNESQRTATYNNGQLTTTALNYDNISVHTRSALTLYTARLFTLEHAVPRVCWSATSWQHRRAIIPCDRNFQCSILFVNRQLPFNMQINAKLRKVSIWSFLIAHKESVWEKGEGENSNVDSPASCVLPRESRVQLVEKFQSGSNRQDAKRKRSTSDATDTW